MQQVESKSSRRQFWKNHVMTQPSSGLSQAEYCRRHDLKSFHFSYYKKKLGPRSDVPVKTRRSRLMVPVEVRPELRHAVVRIVAATGVVIECPTSVSPDWVAAIIRGLSQ